MMRITAAVLTVRKVCTNFSIYSTSGATKLTPNPLDYWAMNRFIRVTNVRSSALLQVLCLLFTLLLGSTVVAEIHIQKTPDGGVQPRLTVDDSGNIHLLYFKKRLSAPSAREGNLYYRQYLPEQNRFGLPIKVSSNAYDIRTFSIARASMAVGGDGRVHVVWYLPRDNQYFYTRSNTERSKFETQQPVVDEFGEGLDAGADIAALGSQVAIVWGAGALSREYERTVYGRISTDSGATFSDELQMGDKELGACACCSLATNFGDENELSIAYRSAIDGVGRHMQALTLQFADKKIQAARYDELTPLQEWELSACPLSTNDITVDAEANQWLVFETEGRINQLKLGTGEEAMPVAEPFIKTRQKNPAVAINREGSRLIVWGEGISHTRGGRLNMQLFAADGSDKGPGFAEEISIPNFSFPAATALPDGSFLVLY
ncbi:MAG: hypothetical protein COB20_04140 [SAR86 cluster bacterium]|uniref:Sialidase domain-containing protein n=1 Tax=SAR86 cluster bacterium TaxID=2030880 RepID=A0A2A4XAV8_9GAMM|nr:MAG: hypothetical protein COB20_04140 [SAR86 cluster bacterium]